MKYEDFVDGLTNTVSDQLESEQRVPFLLTLSMRDTNESATGFLDALRKKGSHVLRQHRRFNRFLNSNLEKNFTKPSKREFLTKTIDFVDFAGTKDQSGSWSTASTPHCHSIYLVHSKNVARFVDMAAFGFEKIVTHHSNPLFYQAHAVTISYNLREVVAYASKFLRHVWYLGYDHISEFYDVHVLSSPGRTEKLPSVGCRAGGVKV